MSREEKIESLLTQAHCVSRNITMRCRYRQNSALSIYVNGASVFVNGAFIFVNGAFIFLNGVSYVYTPSFL